MSVRMRFVELALTTESGRHPYRFRPGVNVIAGPVGVGKSSLFELCKYALGGRGVLTWAVHQAVQRVSLSLSIGGGDYLFVRDIGTASKTVEFRDGRDGSLIETCDVEPRGERQWISDVLLGLLEIPARRIVRATNRPAAETVAISFNDIYRYLYVPQAEIDRSVVRHLDRTLHRKRRCRPAAGVKVDGRRFLRRAANSRRRTYTRDTTSIAQRAHPCRDGRADRRRHHR